MKIAPLFATAAAVLALLLVTASGSWADTLQIGPGTGTDPVRLSSGTSFTVFNNPGNSGADIATLVLFFAVPTASVGSFSVAGASPSLTFVTSLTMTSSGCGDVYTCFGGVFAGLNNSNSFVNFTAGATAAGLTAPTSYTIFEYTDGSILHKQTLTFTGVSLPAGTYIDGAGAQADGGEGFTAFTNAGLVTTRLVPEPATMVLFGSGLIGLAGLVRRRMR